MSSSQTPSPNLAFEPFLLNKNITIKNRFFKSAMSEQLGDQNNNPTEGLAQLYKTWAKGGTGLLVTGNIMIDPTALGEQKNVVLDKDSPLDLFKMWTKAGTENGTQLWAQINHPGKQIPKFLSKEPVAPSALSLGGGLEKIFNTPKALTHDEILSIIDKYAQTAALAKEAGFSGVQIHGAHGYLVSQFLSPRHNIREDQWGGDPTKRSKFILEVYRKIRKAVGKDFPIGIKLNSADFQRGGFTETESMHVIKLMSSEGIDLIEISGGTYESPAMTGPRKKVKKSTKLREAYFLEYAQKAREIVKTPLVVTGGFRSLSVMNEALESGSTDLIGLARPLALKPDLPNAFLNKELKVADGGNPTTGNAFLDKMSMLSITWYEHQLQRMAKGKPPNPTASAWTSMASTMMGTGLSAFRKRRA